MTEEKKRHKRHGAVSANKLLERAPEKAYVEEWTQLLSEGQETPTDTNEVAAILFRIGGEWLAFPALYLTEVSEFKVVHKIPHQRNPIFLGLINLKGQLKLCINLGELLEIKQAVSNDLRVKDHYKRMISIYKNGYQWIFPVDEVLGVFHFNPDQMENVPVTVMKSRVNYTKGIIERRGHNIAFLDEELIFASLERSLQ